VKIDFDPKKDAENIRKHGISLARAEDFVAVASIEDDRFDYSEIRVRAFGFIDEVPHCLVFTIRGQELRLISLRRAHAREMKRYVP
jgi:uncharacterized DUF497 family protein